MTLQTLYTAKACKNRITTQGFPCKKPVLSCKGLQCICYAKDIDYQQKLVPFLSLLWLVLSYESEKFKKRSWFLAIHLFKISVLLTYLIITEMNSEYVSYGVFFYITSRSFLSFFSMDVWEYLLHCSFFEMFQNVIKTIFIGTYQ